MVRHRRPADRRGGVRHDVTSTLSPSSCRQPRRNRPSAAVRLLENTSACIRRPALAIGDRDPALPALRHRPGHQPHPGLRRPDRDARGGVPRPRSWCCGSPSSPLTAGPTSPSPASTLAVAALFRPLRARYPGWSWTAGSTAAAYDAARTLESSPPELRDELDLEACSATCARRSTTRSSRPRARSGSTGTARVSGWSDRGLRRLAWAGWWVVAVLAIFETWSPRSATPTPRVSWGTGLLGELGFTLVVLAFPLVGLGILVRQPAQPDRLAARGRSAWPGPCPACWTPTPTTAW